MRQHPYRRNSYGGEDEKKKSQKEFMLEVTDDDIHEVTRALWSDDPRYTHLRLLRMCASNARLFFQALKSNTTVTMLDLPAGVFSEPDVRRDFVHMLECNNTVQTLALKVPPLASDWRDLGNELIRGGSNIRLKQLEIVGELHWFTRRNFRGRKNQYLNLLASTFSLDPSRRDSLNVLTEIFLAHPNIAQEGLKLDVRIFQRQRQESFFRALLSSNVQSFSLSRRLWGAYDLRALGACLRERRCRLQRLDMDLYYFDIPQIHHFLDCLCSNTSLTSLGLSRIMQRSERFTLPDIPNLREFRLRQGCDGGCSVCGGGSDIKLEISALKRMPLLEDVEFTAIPAALLEDFLLCLGCRHRKVKRVSFSLDMYEDRWRVADDLLGEWIAYANRVFVPEAFDGAQQLSFSSLGRIPQVPEEIVYNSLCVALTNSPSITTIDIPVTVHSSASLQILVERLLPKLPKLESFRMAIEPSIKKECEDCLLDTALACKRLFDISIVVDDRDGRGTPLDLPEELQSLCEKNRIGFPAPHVLSAAASSGHASPLALWPHVLSQVRRLDVLFAVVHANHNEFLFP